jgi:hypothetical protein
MVNAEYPVPQSAALIEEARTTIFRVVLREHVEMRTDFLADEESFALLSDVDLIVFPYQQTGESSSAAVRYGLATGVPVAVTPLAIFDDVASAVFQLPGQSPDQIASGIRQLLGEVVRDSPVVRDKRESADRWREAHRYSGLGQRLHGMLRGLARQRCIGETSLDSSQDRVPL